MKPINMILTLLMKVKVDVKVQGGANRTYNDCPDYGNNVEINTPEMSSDEDDLAAILDLPPVRVKTELRKGINTTVLMSEGGDITNDRCGVVNTITEINMTKDVKDKTEGHEKVPIEIDKIVIKRLFNIEKTRPGRIV
jgi:hypothetical protein